MHRSNFGRTKSATPHIKKLIDVAENKVEQRVDAKLERELALVASKISILDKKFEIVFSRIDELIRSRLTGVRSDVEGLVIDLNREMNAVKASLSSVIKTVNYDSKFASVQSSLKDVTPSLKMLTTSVNALVKRKSVKGADDVLAGGILDIVQRLEAIADKPPAATTTPDLSAVIDLVQAPKRVVRDQNGNITGWELKKGKLN